MQKGETVNQIRSYLDKTGKKQYELAAEIGAPVQTVNRWLTGKTKISHAYVTVLKSKGIVG